MSERQVLTLTLPMPPNLTNGRMHHMVKHRVKVGYWALLDLIVFRSYDQAALKWFYDYSKRAPHPALRSEMERLAAVNILDYNGQPWPAETPFAQISVRSCMNLGASMDDDNALARHKWVFDWMKNRAYIVDDKKKCVQWESLPEQVVKRDGNYRITLTLTPILPAQGGPTKA